MHLHSTRQIICYDFEKIENRVNIIGIFAEYIVLPCFYVKISHEDTYENERIKVQFFKCVFGVGADLHEYTGIFPVTGEFTLKMFAMLFYSELKLYGYCITIRKLPYWFSARFHHRVNIMNYMDYWFKRNKREKVQFILQHGSHLLVAGSKDKLFNNNDEKK